MGFVIGVFVGMILGEICMCIVIIGSDHDDG